MIKYKFMPVIVISTCLIFFSLNVFSGAGFASGKITSLLAHGNDPGIRLTDNVSPDNCDGGPWGWLRFAGTPEERSRVYASALALSLAGKTVTVYTNTDGTACRIGNIQVTRDLNE